MDPQQVAAIQHQRDACADKIASFGARGPELSRMHHERIVSSTLLTFTTLYKLAVLIRGDYDARTSGNPENPELTEFCAEFARVAEKGEAAGDAGFDAMSRITQDMAEWRGTDMANLIKSVQDGQMEANNARDAANEQRSALQERLNTARASLQSTQETLSGTEGKLRDTQEDIKKFNLAKDISWIMPWLRGVLEAVDKLFKIEEDLKNSIHDLANIASNQANMVAACENDIHDTESRIAVATTTAELYTHILADLGTLQGNCDDLLAKSRATEAELVELKTKMRRLYRAAVEILGKSQDANYFTTKLELVGVILDVLNEGCIDNSLFPEIESIIRELKANDVAGLLSTPEEQNKLDALAKRGVSI